MDDTAQQNQGDLGNQGVTQPIAQPSTPISTPQKEQGPVASAQTEFIKPSEAEPHIPNELKEIGVEQKAEVQPLPQAAEKVGVKLANEAAPVITKPSGVVQLPKTETQVIVGLKTQKNPSNSVSWWLLSILRQFKKMHTQLKGG